MEETQATGEGVDNQICMLKRSSWGGVKTGDEDSSGEPGVVTQMRESRSLT